MVRRPTTHTMVPGPLQARSVDDGSRVTRRVLRIAFAALALPASAACAVRPASTPTSDGASPEPLAAMVATAAPVFTEQMAWDALRKDGGNAAALDTLTRAAWLVRDHAAVMRILERCLAAQPDACACRARRAEAEMQSRAADLALTDARAAFAVCPADVSVRVTLVTALASHGDGELAEQEVRTALESNDDPRLHYALAFAYERQGRPADALIEAKLAVDRGAGRDAGVLLGMLTIDAGDLDAATRALTPLVAADPTDAEAQYDLALVNDRRGNYDAARAGYLAALRAEPLLSDARYNITLLALRHGQTDEARYHARLFNESFPTDLRGAKLARAAASASR